MRTPPSWLVEVAFAHRGLHDAAAGPPENSLASFAAAIEAGYGIECDLQLSADGQAMVFHDDTLDRVSNMSGPVVEYDAETLASVRLFDSDETIPCLRKLLDLAAGRVPLLIELKGWRHPAGSLEAAAWHPLQAYRGPFAVQSFNPGSVAWFRRYAPDALRGQVSSRFRKVKHGRSAWQLFQMRHLLPALSARPDFIAYDIESLPHPAPALARRLGLPLLAWTVRTSAQLVKARGLADNVIFEHIRP